MKKCLRAIWSLKEKFLRDHYGKNPDYIHHYSPAYLYGREIVFGMQDGMVSTLGALAGIAVGSSDTFTVLLSGVSIIAVASISMAIGTFNSISTERKMHERMLFEERSEIEASPVEERREIETMFLKDGWPKSVAEQMAFVASRDESLMLREMAYRELSISPEKIGHPVKNSVAMFFAWLFGGTIPLLPYFFLPAALGVYASAAVTLLGLFLLGAVMTVYTKEFFLKAGLRTLLLAGFALAAGYGIGHFADILVMH